MIEPTTVLDTLELADTGAIDDLSWEDWSPAAVCALENGPDCEACEG